MAQEGKGDNIGARIKEMAKAHRAQFSNSCSGRPERSVVAVMLLMAAEAKSGKHGNEVRRKRVCAACVRSLDHSLKRHTIGQ